MFDLIFSQQEGFEKFSKVILKYYEIFDYIDKILGYIILYFQLLYTIKKVDIIQFLENFWMVLLELYVIYTQH